MLQYISRYLDNELKPIIRWRYLREDIGAALAVTFVAIPLSLSIALATGVAPQVALISAIVGGILGALFGGCRLGITGPALTMSVLLSETIASFGFTGLILVGVICGIFQLVLGVLKLGRIAKYIPLSLILAFTAGIGFLLFFQQLPRAFQFATDNNNTVKDTFIHIQLYIEHINSVAFLMTLLTIAILAVVPRFMPRAYSFLLAVVIPALVIKVFNLNLAVIGPIPHDLIHLRDIDFARVHDWSHLILTGVEVFILASLETLLSTSAVDLMGKGDLHNPNQELIGQGIANIGVAFFGGVPVTGIVARSSVNVLAGAKTRRAAILQAIFVLGIVYFFPRIIENMPIAVLAGILLAASFKMMNFRQVIDLWKSDRLDFLVYFITFFAIIATDLAEGVRTGLLAAFIIVAIRMLKTKTEIKLWTNNNVLRVSLTGNLTFLSYESLAKIKDYAVATSGINFVIFEFGQLQNIDGSGAKHLIGIAGELHDLHIQVIFHGMNDEQQKVILSNTFENKPYVTTITEYQIKDILEKSGITHSANDVLRHGIIKYVSYYAKDNQRLLSTLAQGQKPHTLLITCSDSRLNPNAFFSANIGEIFIVRNVGNVVPPYMPDNIYGEIAAIEFAVAELGIRNIVVCAHTECGAVKASIASGDNKLGYIGLDNWLSLIKSGFKLKPPANIEDGIRINLLHQVDNLKTYPQLEPFFASHELTVNAWIYDVHSGHMLEWDESKQDFLTIT